MIWSEAGLKIDGFGDSETRRTERSVEASSCFILARSSYVPHSDRARLKTTKRGCRIRIVVHFGLAAGGGIVAAGHRMGVVTRGRVLQHHVNNTTYCSLIVYQGLADCSVANDGISVDGVMFARRIVVLPGASD